MQNLFRSIDRTLSQLFEPKFLKVFFLGIVTTIAAIIAAYFLARGVMDHYLSATFDWEWVNDVVIWLTSGWLFNLLFFFVITFFFAPISTIFMSIFLDDIIDAVEDRYYPENKAGKRLGIIPIAVLGLRLAGMMLLVNIIAIPGYLILLFTAVGPIILFYIINAYLLGWGFYEMVAVRHLGIKEAGVHRKAIRAQVMLGGLVLTGLYTIPFVNITAPILGAAMFCHIFHFSMRQREY